MNMNRADDVSNTNGLDNVGGANDTDGRNEVSETNDMKCRQMAQTIHGRSRYGHELVGMLGPAFVAAIAYVDPGNVAANITSGARYGYLLVWVLVLANCMSVLFNINPRNSALSQEIVFRKS